MIEIIYMTTYLKQNSSKPSIFQRNVWEDQIPFYEEFF